LKRKEDQKKKTFQFLRSVTKVRRGGNKKKKKRKKTTNDDHDGAVCGKREGKEKKKKKVKYGYVCNVKYPLLSTPI